ncbi:ankyrin repeat domain-containing protein [Candidatus Phycorickettsia trachydisci]|nr:ankyrin repeat domain-containing protein [Candidatus Phycorickettsia trachydisci]
MKKFINMLGNKNNDAQKLADAIKMPENKYSSKSLIKPHIRIEDREAKLSIIEKEMNDLLKSLENTEATKEGIAALNDEFKVIMTKIRSQPNLQEALDNMLLVAVHYDDIKTMDIIIRAGADVNAKDMANHTLLDKAICADKNRAALVLLTNNAKIDITKPFHVNYLSSSTMLYIFEYGNSYQKFKAWLNIFNTFRQVSDDPQYTQLSQKITKSLAIAWNHIDLDELKMTFIAKKIGDISNPTVDLYNALEFYRNNKDKYKESNTELYDLLQKLVPELEESVNQLNNYKANLMFIHIKSEAQTSEFKTIIEKCIAECRSLQDEVFLEEFLRHYFFQSDELTDAIPILCEEIEVAHLGSDSIVEMELTSKAN